MFDLGSEMTLAWYLLEAKLGRQPTSDEYGAELKRIWDGWMDASVARDMTRAGFVQTPAGEWTKPKRGLLARLFGG